MKATKDEVNNVAEKLGLVLSSAEAQSVCEHLNSQLESFEVLNIHDADNDEPELGFLVERRRVC